MKKKIKVTTVIDPAQKNGDAGAFVQAAVSKKGIIHILRTGTMPFIPEQTPAPAAEVYEKLKKAVLNNEVRLPSPDMVDAMSVYVGYHPQSWVKPNTTKSRPPSTHKRTYKKGSKIRNIATFRKWCMNGGPVYYNHKFMHYGFIVSMPFRAICDALSRGIIWKAVRL